MKTYNVTTTVTIANEMARYDNAQYKRGRFVRLGYIKPITIERDAIAWCNEHGFDAHDMLQYEFTFTSERVTIKRWQSFGVCVNVNDHVPDQPTYNEK